VTLEDTVAERVPEYIRRVVKARAFSLNQTDHAQGHILPDVEGWLRLGIGGLRARVLTGARRHAGNSPSGKTTFYEAAGIALDAAAHFMRRYARLAAQMACSEPEPVRRRELQEIALRCRRLAEHPPRNFPEALQSVWFLFVLLQMESNASSFSPGRLDQYLLPYLEHDLEQDALTLDEAQEWLELLWLKFNEIVLLRSSASARYFAGFPRLNAIWVSRRARPTCSATCACAGRRRLATPSHPRGGSLPRFVMKAECRDDG
jgi:formate C-acetyltransferase